MIGFGEGVKKKQGMWGKWRNFFYPCCLQTVNIKSFWKTKTGDFTFTSSPRHKETRIFGKKRLFSGKKMPKVKVSERLFSSVCCC